MRYSSETIHHFTCSGAGIANLSTAQPDSYRGIDSTRPIVSRSRNRLTSWVRGPHRRPHSSTVSATGQNQQIDEYKYSKRTIYGNWPANVRLANEVNDVRPSERTGATHRLNIGAPGENTFNDQKIGVKLIIF